MSLAENVSARVAYKAYASGEITANTLATSSSDLGASSAQVLRRTTCTLNLAKDTYEASEIQSHRQVSDFRHGVKRVQGSINGELSPGTYWDFLEAAMRGTEASAVALSESDLTSATFDATASTVVFGGGNPHTLGLRVGHILRFTNLAETANNSINFVILKMEGANNRTVTLYPAPTTAGSDTAFNVTSVGKSVHVPATGHVSRKFGVEVYNTETGVGTHRLFTECRVGGVKLALPATGLSTIEIPMMGRDMETGSADDTPSTGPFFTSPTDPTSTGLLAAVNGLVRVGGVNVGVITGATIDYMMEMTGPAVVGQSFVPEIFLGRSRCTGQLTAFYQDLTMVNQFKNETEVEILLYLAASSSSAADAMTVYMPRVKFGGADVSTDGEAGMAITMPFTALKYATAGAGIEATTIQFCDTAAA
jgi:hypothetical protein